MWIWFDKSNPKEKIQNPIEENPNPKSNQKNQRICGFDKSSNQILPISGLTAQLSTWVAEGKKRMIHIIWKRSGEWEEGRNNAMWVLDITFRITASFTPFLGRPENDSAFKCFSHLPKVNLIVMLTDQTTRQGDQDTTKVGKRISRAISKFLATGFIQCRGYTS